MSWHDASGIAGVLLIVGAYLQLQRRVWSTDDLKYSASNAVGAGLVLVSLVEKFNLSAFLVELFWMIISLYGMWAWQARRASERRRTER